MHRARINSIDLLRGIVIILMVLDHVRMYFGQGSWYADPTDLAHSTIPLFLTRWITHICAPVFIFLAGTSAFLYGTRLQDNPKLFRWSEPLRVDNELSNINSWREIHEKDEATLRPSIQDISSSRT